MSQYVVEIINNQPYYVEVENSNVKDIINLTVTRDNDVNVEVSTSNTFVTFDLPSGYPIEATSGYLPYTRVSDLGSYIQSLIPDFSSIDVDGGTP